MKKAHCIKIKRMDRGPRSRSYRCTADCTVNIVDFTKELALLL